jgi:hypothetical protein
MTEDGFSGDEADVLKACAGRTEEPKKETRRSGFLWWSLIEEA